MPAQEMVKNLLNEDLSRAFVSEIHSVIEQMTGDVAPMPNYGRLEIVRVGSAAYIERQGDITRCIIPVSRTFGQEYVVCIKNSFELI